MAISLSGIGNTAVKAVKTISGKPLGLATKVLGAATVASIIYDSHINGRETAFRRDEVNSADRVFNLHKQYMTSPSNSATIAQLKKGWFYSQLTSDCFHFWTKAKGYGEGLFNTIGGNLPRLALSAVTLLSLRNKNKAIATAGKIAGCVLGLSWGRQIFTDVMGKTAKNPERGY
ncbi:hypothetical protein IJ182_08940 [bacterium]|nr:hypothetical protein [bacterium]